MEGRDRRHERHSQKAWKEETEGMEGRGRRHERQSQKAESEGKIKA